MVPARMLSVPGFRRDLERLVSQPREVLSAVAELAGGPEGFDVSAAVELQDRYGLSVSEAQSLLRVSGYLYDRVTTTSIPLEEAVEQVLGAVSDVRPGDEDDRRGALESILRYKGEYERGRLASVRTLGVGPRFAGVDGAWTVSVFVTREEEVIKKPVLSFVLYWRDSFGNDLEAAFRMSSEEWEEFRSVIEDMDAARSAIQRYAD